MKRTFPEKSEVYEDDEFNVMQPGSIYAMYRYTFPEKMSSLEEQTDKTKEIIIYLKKYMINNYYVAAIEKFNKFGNETAPHCHICFMTTGSMDTIRRSLKRNFDVNKSTKHCLKPFVEIDHEKFWRYSLKQQMGTTRQWFDYGGFTEEQVCNMIRVANESYRTTVEINQDKEDKTFNKRTARERLYIELDKGVYENVYEIFDASLEWCLKVEGQLMSENSFKNIVYYYALDRGIISRYEYLTDVLKLKL